MNIIITVTYASTVQNLNMKQETSKIFCQIILVNICIRDSNFRLHIFFPPLLNRFGFMSPNISINRGIQNKITIIITFSIQWIKIFLSIINAWYNPFPHFTQTKKSCIYSYFLVKYKFVNFLFLGLYCPSKLAICIDSISSFSSFIL